MRSKEDIAKVFRVVERCGKFRIQRRMFKIWFCVSVVGGFGCYTECDSLSKAEDYVVRCIDSVFEKQKPWKVVSS